MDSVVPVAVVSVVVGALIAAAVFANYFRKQTSQVQSIAPPDAIQKPAPKQSNPRKSHPKPLSHAAADKVLPPFQICRSSTYLRVCLYTDVLI